MKTALHKTLFSLVRLFRFLFQNRHTRFQNTGKRLRNLREGFYFVCKHVQVIYTPVPFACKRTAIFHTHFYGSVFCLPYFCTGFQKLGKRFSNSGKRLQGFRIPVQIIGITVYTLRTQQQIIK